MADEDKIQDSFYYNESPDAEELLLFFKVSQK